MLLVDKPAGPTSHDVVARVRRALKTRAVGHAGTLDPFATGLLVVLVGKATRLARFAEQQPKTYLATARLGFATTTDDLSGEPITTPAEGGPVALPQQVEECLASFRGESLQRPPAYSAKKVEGERSYKLARQGKQVELAEVAVTVHRIELVSYHAPEVVFRTTVSPGTYIRAMARDLGERLGTGGHLTALRREAIGVMQVSEAVSHGQVSAEALQPMRRAVAQLPQLPVTAAEAKALSFGKAIASGAPEGEPVVALSEAGEVVAIGRVAQGMFAPSVVLEGAG